jgi:nucleotidyltransferase/DNA polymerase involved in DNA repair
MMFATIYVPNFYLQAATRHQPELRGKPVALIEEHDRKPVIIQLNDAAENTGIRKGMTPSQALARCLSVVIKARAHMQEESIEEILVQCVCTLSPFVETTDAGICTVQFMEWHRHPADNRLAGSQCHDKILRVIQHLAECEIRAQAAIAPTPDTSLLAAHLARQVLEVEDAKEFLAPLPIETLGTGSLAWC